MNDQQIYYHFVSADKHLQYDMREQEVNVGLHLKMDAEPILCQRGYHASISPLDALKYAPRDAIWLCGVTLSGTIYHDTDKSVANERTVVWMLNVHKLLVDFACWCAEQAFTEIRRLGIEPDWRSIEAIRIARLWIKDQATDDEVKTAAHAAAYAADVADAADVAAYAADVAAYAARAAAYAADVAAYAARAARAAAYAAARAADAKQREYLKSLIDAALTERSQP